MFLPTPALVAKLLQFVNGRFAPEHGTLEGWLRPIMAAAPRVMVFNTVSIPKLIRAEPDPKPQCANRREVHGWAQKRARSCLGGAGGLSRKKTAEIAEKKESRRDRRAVAPVAAVRFRNEAAPKARNKTFPSAPSTSHAAISAISAALSSSAISAVILSSSSLTSQPQTPSPTGT